MSPSRDQRGTPHRARASGSEAHDPTYRAWQMMNDACSNEGSPKFKECGALGIVVAPAWRSDFEAFLEDMGERPDGAILGRIDEGSDFESGNCCWVTARTRSRRAVEGWQRRSSRAGRILPPNTELPSSPTILISSQRTK